MLFLYMSLIDDENDKSKFEQLYYMYDKLMMNVAMSKLHDIDMAEDVLQDSWLYIAINFEKVGDINSVSTRNYLATITAGFAINKFNKNNKTILLPLDEAISSISDEYFNQFETVELKLAIDTLNDESQNLLHHLNLHSLFSPFGLSEKITIPLHHFRSIFYVLSMIVNAANFIFINVR